MSHKEIVGVCSLCGREGKLSFEHVPPESTFNATKVKAVSIEEILANEDDRMPWEIADLRGKIQQKGSGGYYLCEDCNNKTGSWYAAHYKRFVHALCEVANEIKEKDMVAAQIQLRRLRLLAIYKQILVMFCDINNGCFGDEAVKEFLLDKTSNEIDTEKYILYMYLSDGTMNKQTGLMVRAQLGGDSKEMYLVSEIVSYPVGFALYIDLPDSVKPKGTNISLFASKNYEEENDIDIYLEMLNTNTIFPADYRTKEEIIESRKQNEEQIIKIRQSHSR